MLKNYFKTAWRNLVKNSANGVLTETTAKNISEVLITKNFANKVA